MARQTKALTDAEVKGAKPKEKDYKLFDGRGLFLLVTKNGGKRWRLKYRFDGKEKVLALGIYPDIKLAVARELGGEFKGQVAKGIDPSEERRAKKKEIEVKEKKVINTFEKIAADHFKLRTDLSESYKTRLESAFKKDVYPFIGKKPIVEVTHDDIIEIVKRVEKRGAIESAHRLFVQIRKVFKFATTNQKAKVNPCNNMDKSLILVKANEKSYPTITDKREIGILLNAIDNYSGHYTVKMALKLLPYVFVRPANIRFAEWKEIDFENRMWTIPAEKMKMKKKEKKKEENYHLVPLTDTTIEILREMKEFSGDAKYIFHSLRDTKTPMSDATLVNALRRMGYSKNELVAHSFRAMFSTVANNDGLGDYEVIETQLSHKIGTSVARKYNRADYMEKRINLMQKWSDYLDEAKNEVE